MVSGAPAHLDLLESASLILRHGLEPRARNYGRLLMRIGAQWPALRPDYRAIRGGRTARSSSPSSRRRSASPAERAEKDLDPRLVGACVGSLLPRLGRR